MALSTTMPMASTSANSVIRLMVRPNICMNDEGADQRHRHGQRRDQRRAPVAQEDEHDQGHQHERLAERVDAPARSTRRGSVDTS